MICIVLKLHSVCCYYLLLHNNNLNPVFRQAWNQALQDIHCIKKQDPKGVLPVYALLRFLHLILKTVEFMAAIGIEVFQLVIEPFDVVLGCVLSCQEEQRSL